MEESLWEPVWSVVRLRMMRKLTAEVRAIETRLCFSFDAALHRKQHPSLIFKCVTQHVSLYILWARWLLRNVSLYWTLWKGNQSRVYSSSLCRRLTFSLKWAELLLLSPLHLCRWSHWRPGREWCNNLSWSEDFAHVLTFALSSNKVPMVQKHIVSKTCFQSFFSPL